MRALVSVCVGVAVVSGIVSANLWLELRSAHQQNEELRAQLALARIPAPPLLPSMRTAVAPAVADAAAPTTTAKSAIQPIPAPTLEARSEEARANLSTLLLATNASNAELRKDPEYRKAQLAQRRLELAQTYPGLKEELGLSDKEADRLFEVLAENTINFADQNISLLAAKPGELAEAMRKQNESQTQAVRALLGETKYAQYMDYQQTRPARNQARTLGNTLTAMGAPLTESQSRSLTNVLIAEQQRQRQEPPIARPPPDPANPQAQTAQFMADMNNRQTENNRRILEAASSTLSPRQIESLRQQFEREDAVRRSTLSRLQEIRLPAPTAPAQ